MKKVKVGLVLAIALGLLLAVMVTAYADKPGPGKQKPKGGPVPGQNEPKQQKEKKQPKIPKPADIPMPDADDDNGGVMMAVCHKPGTPGEQTLLVSGSALKAHLKHGDTQGACAGLPAPGPVPTDTLPPPTSTLTTTVTLCHKPGTPAEKTLVLPSAALHGHLRHGDFLGPCPEVSPTPVPTDTIPPPTSTVTLTHTITLCHKPGTPAEKTLVLPETAGPGHLRHGDTLGACPELPSVPWGIAYVVPYGIWPMPVAVWKGPQLVLY